MGRLAVGLAVVVALGAGTPARATVDRTVRAGSISATVEPDPFRITIGPLQGLAGDTLATAGAPGQPARKVVDESRDGAAYVATLDNRIRLRVEPDADGVIRVVAAAAGAQGIRASFAAAPDERFLGLGERSNAVDFRGKQVENHVTEGPYQPVERPFVAGFVRPAGYSARDDATYYPVPWVVSTRGYGMLLDSDAVSSFDFASARPDAWTAQVPSESLTFRVFAGPTPAAVLARFTARTGRQPPAAAPWFFGPWWQPKGKDQDNLDTLRKAHALGSVVQTYTHYLPCGSQVGHRDERARTAEVATLTSYGDGVVHLADCARRTTIIGWPSGSSRTEIGPGETVSVKESGRRLIVGVLARRRYRLNLWLSPDLLRRPCKRTHVRHVLVRARKARRAVPACPRSHAG